MVDTQGEGKGMRDLFEKSLGIHSAFMIISLLTARYFFTFSSDIIIYSIQAALFLLAAVVLIAMLGLIRYRNDVNRRPWQIILSLMFVAAGVFSLIRGVAGGSIQGWTIARMANSYLGAMAFITIFGYLVKLAGRVSPSLILPSSFIIVILSGTALLLSPKATTSGIRPIDALFTSTSATCVTGLIVKDTETDFTLAGQMVILILIQVGGLGLMTFAAFFTMSFGQNLGLSDTLNLSRIMDSEFISDLRQILVSILIWTFAIEATGAVLLYNTWAGKGELGWSMGETIWQAVFHSISAFCNAGFSLNSNNLEGFSDSPATGMIMGSLIILGGLGFMVLTLLGKYMLTRMKTGRKSTLPVQARFVLLITGILVLLGWGFFLAAEWNNTLGNMTLWEKLGNSFLQGVTPRTAGFNVVPTNELLPCVKWIFVMLMFIGASPGGTGGGVKTTTIGLLFLSLKSLLKRRQHPEIWKRHIPNFDLQRAGAILAVGMAVFCLCSLVLIMTEHPAGNFSEMDYIFESMSAFGTVGLSTGVTPALSTAGRWVIIVTMFIGRTAPATLAAATVRVHTSRYCYPEDRITIG